MKVAGDKITSVGILRGKTILLDDNILLYYYYITYLTNILCILAISKCLALRVTRWRYKRALTNDGKYFNIYLSILQYELRKEFADVLVRGGRIPVVGRIGT